MLLLKEAAVFTVQCHRTPERARKCWENADDLNSAFRLPFSLLSFINECTTKLSPSVEYSLLIKTRHWGILLTEGRMMGRPIGLFFHYNTIKDYFFHYPPYLGIFPQLSSMWFHAAFVGTLWGWDLRARVSVSLLGNICCICFELLQVDCDHCLCLSLLVRFLYLESTILLCLP